MSALILQAAAFSFFVAAHAEDKKLSPEFEEIKITEKLGNQVSIDQLEFTDEAGKQVKLSQYFHSKKPVIFTMIYYRCPGLCNYMMNGFTNSIRGLEWTPGNEFEIVTVSINSKEGPELAQGKKETYIRKYGRDVPNGWHWLVGREDQIKKLTQELGFGFRFDEASNEFAHSAGIFILTPEGKISRVLYGIDFPYRDLKMSLLEASDGKIGSLVDQVLMFCYKYDPFSRGYAIYALRIVQAGGVLTMFLIGSYLFWFWSRERRKGIGA